MPHLRRAHEIRPEVVRFGYVYAVAQFDQGQKAASLKTLESIRERYPASREILQLLTGYNQQMGRAEAARKYAAELEKLGGSQ